MTKSVYWVYILHCDNNAYYTGYTTDIARRYEEHLAGSAKCKYTRSFKPLRIAQCWQVLGNKALAMKIERYIKNISKDQKLRMIQSPEMLCTTFGLCIIPWARI